MSGRPWLIAVTVDGVNLPRFLRRAGEMGLLLRACASAANISVPLPARMM